MLHLTFEQMYLLIGISIASKVIFALAFALWQTDKDLKESKRRKEENEK